MAAESAWQAFTAKLDRVYPGLNLLRLWYDPSENYWVSEGPRPREFWRIQPQKIFSYMMDQPRYWWSRGIEYRYWCELRERARQRLRGEPQQEIKKKKPRSLEEEYFHRVGFVK